jgi:flagellar assembly protein FliH
MTQQASAGGVLHRVTVQGFVAPARRGAARAGEEPADLVAQAVQQGHAQGLGAGRDEGLAAGYEAGLQEGRAAAQAEISAAAEAAALQAAGALAQRERQLLATASLLQERASELLASVEDEMVLLCYEVICRVLGAAALGREHVQSQVGAALAQWRGRRPLAVLLHPDDAALLDRAPAGAGLAWQADAQVALGGCILRDAQGALDARLEHVLEEVKAALLTARRQGTQSLIRAEAEA